MPKTKSGEIITWREFFSRWKKGIEGITPYQQIKTQMLGSIIVLIGILWGLTVTWFLPNFKWMFLILIGSFIISALGLLGIWQKYKVLKEQEELYKGALKDEN